MDDRESGLRNVLISNGLRRSALVLGYIVTEAIFCLVVSVMSNLDCYNRTSAILDRSRLGVAFLL